MAHCLETRVPFLDNDLVDFALSAPRPLKLRDSPRRSHVDENEPGKRALFQAERTTARWCCARRWSECSRRRRSDRSKQGFSAPDASWFRGESIDYVNRLLRDPKARIYEFVEPAYVQRILDEHTSGRINHRLLIWSLLSFEWWCRSFLESFPARTQGELYAFV